MILILITIKIRRCINYPPRGVGESAQEIFFKAYEDATKSKSVISSKPILDLLLKIGNHQIKSVKKSTKKKSKKNATTSDVQSEGEEGEGEEKGEKEVEGVKVVGDDLDQQEFEAVIDSLTTRQYNALQAASM